MNGWKHNLFVLWFKVESRKTAHIRNPPKENINFVNLELSVWLGGHYEICSIYFHSHKYY